jgi:hypothetical protein
VYLSNSVTELPMRKPGASTLDEALDALKSIRLGARFSMSPVR